MSRGPGRIEAAIKEIALANTTAVFTVEDLAVVAYPGTNRVEKKHRVAVLRAAYKTFNSIGWSSFASERPGGHILFYNPLDVRSYARGRILADPRYWRCSPEDVDALIDVPGVPHSKWSLVQPDGVWAIHVEINKANAAGHQAEVRRLKVLLDQSVARKYGSMISS